MNINSSSPECFGPDRRGKLRVLCGNANYGLSSAVCAALNLTPLASTVGRFANGEIQIKINENVRGDDVFVFQPTCGNDEDLNVNQAIMELLLMIHTLKLASVRRVVAIVPHYGYARQDRKTTSRVPISASAVARMITEMGTDAVVSMDLHCSQIQGFFHACPMTDLSPSAEFARYCRTKGFNMMEVVVVAPDAGAVNRARKLCDTIGASRIVTILKRRVQANVVESMQLVGDVDNAICIISDDMIDTGGTLCKAAEVLKQYGAREVHAWATHGILTDPACDRINKCDALKEVVVTNSIPQHKHLENCSKLRVISVASMFAEVIRKMHNEESIEMLSTDIDSTSGPESPAIEGICNPDKKKKSALEDEDEWKTFPK